MLAGSRTVGIPTCLLLLATTTDCWSWLAVVDGANSRTGLPSDDQLQAVVVDSDGDVLGTGGLSTSAGTHELVVLKRAGGDGKAVWQTLLGQGGGLDLMLDSQGDVVVAGELPSTTSTGVVFGVAKLSGSSGGVLWDRTIEGTGSGTDEARAVVVDANDDVVAVGRVNHDAVAIKVAGASGADVWTRTLSGSASGFDVFSAAAIDPTGDVIVQGAFDDGTNVIKVMKFAGATGIDLWPAPFVPPASPFLLNTMAVDGAGDVVVVTLSGAGITVTKLAGLDGAVVWQSPLAGVAGGAYDIAFHGDHPVIAVGDPFAVVKLDAASGAVLWQHVEANPDSAALGVRVHGDRVVAGGRARDPLTGDDYFAARLDAAAGAPVARYRFDGGTASHDLVRAFALSATGGVVLAGGVHEPAGGFDFGDQNLAILHLDDRLSGKALVMIDEGSASKLIVRARDAKLFASTPGGPGDPTIDGAVLELSNPGTLETATYVLPAAYWEARPNPPPGRQQYKYVDRAAAAGPCSTAIVKSGRVWKVKCTGSLGGFTLDEASQGSLDVRLRLGSDGGPYCLAFGGVRIDRPGEFRASAAAPPSTCD